MASGTLEGLLPTLIRITVTCRPTLPGTAKEVVHVDRHRFSGRFFLTACTDATTCGVSLTRALQPLSLPILACPLLRHFLCNSR